ncbi:hypothetical protein PAEPH01_1079 [Pancytospora epiphaga]|nr:hypothetical protein PAEPH01_1079 [Pancytospora epiphaga]
MASILDKMKEAHEKGDKLQALVEYLEVLDLVILALKTEQDTSNIEHMQNMMSWQSSLRSKCQNLYSQLLESKSKEEMIVMIEDLEATILEGKEKYDVRIGDSVIKE